MNLIDEKARRPRVRDAVTAMAGVVLLAATFVSSASFGLRPALAQTAGLSAPAGWHLTGSKPANYRIGVDRQALHANLPSAYLASTVEQTGGFGTLMQSIAAGQYADKRVRLRAWVRSKDVTDWAGLWMRVDQGQQIAAFDNMQKRAIRGTQAWTSYDVVLDVPSGATGIFFGVLLSGPGEVWLNDVKFEVVGSEVPSTEPPNSTMPAAPVNLGFQN